MPLAYANDALRFLLELAALGALGYWGVRTGSTPLAKLALGAGAPLLAAVVWGAFVAPKASIAVAEPLRLLISLAVFGSGALALFAVGRPAMAWAFSALVAVNVALIQAWDRGLLPDA